VLKAQFYDPSGAPQWTEGGLQINTTDRWVDSPMVINQGDRCLLAWQDFLGKNKLLRRQVVSSGGALYLAQGGAPVVEVLSGIPSGNTTIALDDKYFTAWFDLRSSDYKIYYQFLDSNLNPLLEANGRELNALPGWEQTFRLIALPGNSVAVLYSVTSQGILHGYLQVIDATGNTVYPGCGIHIVEGDYDLYQQDLSYYNGDIYLSWAEYGDYTRVIKAQRVSQGQKMWGETGITLAESDIYGAAQLRSVKGNYFLWDGTDVTENAAMALRLDLNGLPEPGWNQGGMQIFTGSSELQQEILHSGLLGEDLVAFVRCGNYPNRTVRAQKISPAGQRMWSDTGVEVMPSSPWIMDMVYDDAVSMVIMSGSGLRELRWQRISAEGVLSCPPEGNLIASGLQNCFEAYLLKYDNGYMACYWSDNSYDPQGWHDIFMRGISPQGQAMGNAPIVLCDAPFGQRSISAASIGENAMLVWQDDRAGLYDPDEFLSSIRARRISSFPVDNSDDLNPPAQLASLMQNYPNPFNPITTISFELAEAQKASLRIYNLKGQVVSTLLSDGNLPAGAHSLIWDGKDEQGRSVASGIYLYRLSTPKLQITKKMVLAK
ncbi:MAG: FlgD immunoglobulin-like domain containing protein, partial [Candidatus Cloacimonadaceae bacterium]|nr:FlgD immunoglobulin-like domain containing protein [Candidatus Cloacimonadaceae bacterium]